MIYPWQQEQWQQLWQAKQENRLPHALLFAGIAGIGKTDFADYFARVLLCQHVKTSGFACDTCHSCRLMIGKSHPNILWIAPEKTGQAIKVDQIRAVTEFISQTSLQGEYRLVMIHPANDMNTNAANALLKTLEEPASGSIMILISDQAAHLPATILSRCQKIIFSRPSTASALAWMKEQSPEIAEQAELLLRLTNGAPLAARQLLATDLLTERQELLSALSQLSTKQLDPIKLAANLPDLDTLQLLDFMLGWIMDILRLQLGEDPQAIINVDYTTPLVTLAKSTQVQTNAKFMAHIQQLRGQITAGVNFNKQLMIESLLIRWMECST